MAQSADGVYLVLGHKVTFRAVIREDRNDIFFSERKQSQRGKYYPLCHRELPERQGSGLSCVVQSN